MFDDIKTFHEKRNSDVTSSITCNKSTASEQNDMKYPLLDHGTPSERLVLLSKNNKIGESTSDVRYIHRSHPPSSGKLLQKRRGWFLLQVIAAMLLTGFGIWTLAFRQNKFINESLTSSPDNNGLIEYANDGIPRCLQPPCFTPARIRVATDRPSFPSFWNYAHRGPLHVTYDHRAMKINGRRVFFLAGSLHPSRATKSTWNHALDEAVLNGLNMITIYVMWSAHQPFPSTEIDWGFHESDPSGDDGWNLATALRATADRGLFVHIRIGPYDCAEYNYGGIPEWLPLQKPNMALRRPNREWLDTMEDIVTKMINYLTEHQLWAHQGGNIVMAQIENELGQDDDVHENTDHMLMFDMTSGTLVDPPSNEEEDALVSGRNMRKATLQDYADWCGDLAAKLAPNVTWTMCNGLSANNTILTCNAVNNGGSWLEHYGGNGRIQVDQPPIFTEFEGGFQVWGEEADKPLNYFWGRKARDMTRDAMKWFARGGTHLNHYMWWGGYNRGRTAASGIANWYASDVPLCPSGQRRQPKFGHFQALHGVMQSIATTLVTAETALGKGQPIPFLTQNGNWETGTEQRMFVYEVESDDDEDEETNDFRRVIFVENDSQDQVEVLVDHAYPDGLHRRLTMQPFSSMLLVDGIVEFDSASIDPRTMAFERKFASKDDVPLLLDWSTWQEPVGAVASNPLTQTSSTPIEQTALNVESAAYSDYAWYETSFSMEESSNESIKLFVDTREANAFVVYVDGQYAGSADRHFHGETPFTMTIDLGVISKGDHTLSLLSESLGYSNLIGRFGGGTSAKLKGITGDVILSDGPNNENNISLVDGREWRSYPGLHGEALGKNNDRGRSVVRRKNLQMNLSPGVDLLPRWSSSLFDTPRFDPTFQGLFLKVTTGRGHLWLNGRDLGRFWNITRGESGKYSQEYYFLPDDYFYTDGNLNEIILFDAFGEGSTSSELVLSWIGATDSPNFHDEVDFPLACI